MGLASAWALSRRGAAVTMLERFSHVHDRGSHSGYTRVIRHAYHEGSAYVPLIERADREWLALGERTGRSILDRTGLLLFGPEASPELREAFETCRQCRLPFLRTTGAQARQRWPFFMPDDWVTCFDPRGGMLRVAPAMDAFAQEARAAGACLRYGVRVREIAGGSTTTVRLDDGQRLTADYVVVAAGAWLPDLLPHLLPGALTRTRRVLAWTRPAPEHHDALSRIPVWGGLLPDGFFYGFPYGNEGITGLKVAIHTTTRRDLDVPVDPEAVDRTAHPADVDPLREVLDRHLPIGAGPIAATHTCLYTHTPRWDFVVDRLPSDPRVVVAGAFSGHGFKFAPAVGEHVAELVLNGAAPLPGFSIASHGG